MVEEGGGTAFPVGSRVMFTGPYGVSENGTYSEWLAVRKQNLCLIPDNIEDVSAAGIPVAYLTAQMTLSLAGFAKGKTVLSPAIGGSVGNAVTQLARAQGAKHAISTTTNHAKAQQARSLGFDEVIDLSVEKLSDGVRRITEGYGADIVIDAIGGEILSEALGTLAIGGKSDYVGLLRRPQGNHRRHGSDLEAREHEELLPVRTTCGGMERRMERHYSIASIRSGQAHRGKDVPAARSGGCSALPCGGPPLRQGRPHNLKASEETRRAGCKRSGSVNLRKRRNEYEQP